MSHRARLLSLRFGHAVREACWQEPYTRTRLRKDILAGITVGIIAIPLAMALAIASGVPPQHGLYTAIIAGALIAVTGGSRFSVSGPTAAFVVILYPITQKYGLSGLMLASIMAGGLLVLMALLRLGRLITYIPEAVVLGFTTGIAIVIATLQIKDFFGLQLAELPEHYTDKIFLLLQQLPNAHWPSVLVALATLACMLLWPRLKTAVPPHLPAIILGSLLALLLNHWQFPVDTIATRFSYTLANGDVVQGIPAILPSFEWPWHQPGANGAEGEISLAMLRDLVPAAFAIAMLGAIESLLCAVILDGMSGRRHSANSELLGQGIGNIVTPFFGGITATAAIARSSANFRAGAESPMAAVVHALVVLAGLVMLAPLLNYLPMAAMAALLLMVAWGMSEAPKSMHLLKTAPMGDRWILIGCCLLTVAFDMVIAISIGILLAAVLFMKEMADMTRVLDISKQRSLVPEPLPDNWRVFKITGPLFFAAADKIFSELTLYCKQGQGVILYFDNVTMLDAGGLSALERLIQHCRNNGAQLVLTDVQFQPLKTLAKAGTQPIEGVFRLYPNLKDACAALSPNIVAATKPNE